MKPYLIIAELLNYLLNRLAGWTPKKEDELKVDGKHVGWIIFILKASTLELLALVGTLLLGEMVLIGIVSIAIVFTAFGGLAYVFDFKSRFKRIGF